MNSPNRILGPWQTHQRTVDNSVLPSNDALDLSGEKTELDLKPVCKTNIETYIVASIAVRGKCSRVLHSSCCGNGRGEIRLPGEKTELGC